MGDSEQTETERAWMVERSYDSRNLVTLVYATPDGERYLQKELSANMLPQVATTAAIDVEPDRLADVADDETRERYAEEAARMADQHDPDEEV